MPSQHVWLRKGVCVWNMKATSAAISTAAVIGVKKVYQIPGFDIIRYCEMKSIEATFDVGNHTIYMSVLSINIGPFSTEAFSNHNIVVFLCQ
jgi:hypothetical protein